MADDRSWVRPFLLQSWPALVLWGHLALRALLDRMSYETLNSAWPLPVYAVFLGFVIFVFTVWSLVWLIYVWREDDKPSWVRLASAGVLVSGIVAVGVLRTWLD